ncbi:hypothetical protein DRN94_002885, partial [archaeon]|nr:hypothetical protein [archaeon]
MKARASQFALLFLLLLLCLTPLLWNTVRGEESVSKELFQILEYTETITQWGRGWGSPYLNTTAEWAKEILEAADLEVALQPVRQRTWVAESATVVVGEQRIAGWAWWGSPAASQEGRLG